MATRDEFTVGWVCALPVEVAAAKATFDRIITEPLPPKPAEDTNTYVLGILDGHYVVLAHPPSGTYGSTTVSNVVALLHASFGKLRFTLLVGIGGGIPGTKEDIRLGDVVVSRPIEDRPGLLQHDSAATGKDMMHGVMTDEPSILLITAKSKTETAGYFQESRVPLYIARAVQEDPETFAYPGPEQDTLFRRDYNHVPTSEPETCELCDPGQICHRIPRENQFPVVHYGLVIASRQQIRHGTTRDKLAEEQEALCLETEAAGLEDLASCLVIRGVCDYADSHTSTLWHGYSAVAAAAYAKELISLTPTLTRTETLAATIHAMATPILDALLLTRPEVDRTSLIALKGRRVEGTCEWIAETNSYQAWLTDANAPVLWVSGRPGKGKTMLAIFLTETLQPMINSADGVLLYYFCSNRDKNRNSAVTVMRGILHQWIDRCRHLGQYAKSFFEGTETTKHTVSSFVTLWKVFLTLLQHSKPSQVVCVLDGLDECEKDSLKQLLDAIVDQLASPEEKASPQLKFVLLSRPQPAILETRLAQYLRVKLDDSQKEVSNDVKRYVEAKVKELASEQGLTEDMVQQLRQALLAGAEGTFLWVGFVANELKGRSWNDMYDVLHGIPKTLGGIYQRLLQQIDAKEELVPILHWVVLAAQPLTVDDLAAASNVARSGARVTTEDVKRRLVSCGLMVKIEANVVNLVHESAKEFFQSDQADVEGIKMFHMTQHTHAILMKSCLTLIEQTYKTSMTIREQCEQNSLLKYACAYWPEHLRHSIEVIDGQSELSRPFFQAESPLRKEWWDFYWTYERNGGGAPSFTLLHLAAYFGAVAWAAPLLGQHSKFVSRKDNLGRTPLPWAVYRGHRDMVALLLDHGARVNSKDRSRLTAFHIAVTTEHEDIVALLLDRNAYLEAEAESGETPLIRAIGAESKAIVQLLLERGARVDKWPMPPVASRLKASSGSAEELAGHLLGLQQDILDARFEKSSKKVNRAMNALSLSFRIPYLMEGVGLYFRWLSLSRPESQTVLQELVRNNRTVELRRWTQLYRSFFAQLVYARNPKRLDAMANLPSRIFEEVSTADLNPLLVVSVMVGTDCKMTAIREGWREGDLIISQTFSRWASVACRRGAEESMHYGIREFLVDFDACIQSGDRQDTSHRTLFLLTSHLAFLENEQERPIEYLTNVVADFFDGYVGSSHETAFFEDALRTYAGELALIGKNKDSHRLRLFLLSILHCSQHAGQHGQSLFLNMLSSSCLVLCQDRASSHSWLMGEAIPQQFGALISQVPSEELQVRASKTLVECLIIGRQYGLAPAVKLGDTMKAHIISVTERRASVI
jgi:nucleoside phosphorylase